MRNRLHLVIAGTLGLGIAGLGGCQSDTSNDHARTGRGYDNTSGTGAPGPNYDRTSQTASDVKQGKDSGYHGGDGDERGNLQTDSNHQRRYEDGRGASGSGSATPNSGSSSSTTDIKQGKDHGAYGGDVNSSGGVRTDVRTSDPVRPGGNVDIKQGKDSGYHGGDGNEPGNVRSDSNHQGRYEDGRTSGTVSGSTTVREGTGVDRTNAGSTGSAGSGAVTPPPTNSGTNAPTVDDTSSAPRQGTGVDRTNAGSTGGTGSGSAPPRQ